MPCRKRKNSSLPDSVNARAKWPTLYSMYSHSIASYLLKSIRPSTLKTSFSILTLTLKKAKEAMPKDRNQLAAVGETYWLAGAGIGHRGEMPLEGELDIARDSLCGLPQVSGADENGAYKWRPATFVPRPLSLASCAALLYPCLS